MTMNLLIIWNSLIFWVTRKQNEDIVFRFCMRNLLKIERIKGKSFVWESFTNEDLISREYFIAFHKNSFIMFKVLFCLFLSLGHSCPTNSQTHLEMVVNLPTGAHYLPLWRCWFWNKSCNFKPELTWNISWSPTWAWILSTLACARLWFRSQETDKTW